MINSAISSLTIISPANWFGQHRVSYLSGSSFELSSPPRELFTLRTDTYQNKKDLRQCFESSSSRNLGRCLVHPVFALSKNIDFPHYLDPAASHRTTSRKEKNPLKLSSRASQIKSLDHNLVIKYPIVTESAMKAMLENNTLVLVVDKRADKYDVKDAVRTMFQVKVQKVNTLMLPNGAKKAFVKLEPDYNATDVAKKNRIM